MKEHSEREKDEAAADELVAWYQKHTERGSAGVLAGMLVSAAAELISNVPGAERALFIEIAGRAWDRWQLRKAHRARNQPS